MDPMNLHAAMAVIEQLIASATHADCSLIVGQLEQLKGLAWTKIMYGQAAPQPTTNAGDLLTIPEAAMRLKLSAYRVYELARQGRLRTVKIGKSVRVTQSAVNEFVTRLNGGKAA